jgi:hypothetical protein
MFYYTGFRKKQKRGAIIVEDKLSAFIIYRVATAIFFRGNLIVTTIMGMVNSRGRRRYQAEIWIMNSGKIEGIEYVD